MKWQLSILAILATLALAHPQNQVGGSSRVGQGNQGQGQGQVQAGGQGAQGQGQGNDAADGTAAAADDVNAKANNGEDGIEAAAKVDAAVLLSEAGDPGAQDSGPEFEAAVKKIVNEGNQDDIDTLEAAGVDVDAVVGGGKKGKSNGGANAQAQQAQNGN